jgi:hypothetical protein
VLFSNCALVATSVAYLRDLRIQLEITPWLKVTVPGKSCKTTPLLPAVIVTLSTLDIDGCPYIFGYYHSYRNTAISFSNRIEP